MSYFVPHTLELIYFHKNISLDSSVFFCLCSGQPETFVVEHHLLETEDSSKTSYLSFSISLFSIGTYYDYGTSCISVPVLFAFELVVTIYIASWTTYVLFCLFLLRDSMYSMSMILIYDSHIHINPIDNLCFELFKLTCVDYCRFKWFKYKDRHKISLLSLWIAI